VTAAAVLRHVLVEIKARKFRVDPGFVRDGAQALAFGNRRGFHFLSKLVLGRGLNPEPLIVFS
jgi:hypothetical protein